jgi:hypothetical protein
MYRRLNESPNDDHVERADLYGRQESRAMPLDHAELSSQEMREHAEANGACEALLGMI